ncbi:alcohol dehydrogenase [Variibacter gotjawalensis]|uniref:Alcohol dehydrogenase n=1 Tax=Variibacter gotjawalensis TaxID=1333996 RepID=A0A0S3Q0R0_9BRAD|nr:NADPH:quinone oxidoreductase family protein [Variibacter gotjawalensis]NIK47628.1 NADPH2:quinone reductase [Variibacter gotjawalensis]RZS49525.1 NADPH2:quinone reductase [Variibacter gotjawalensis]BAT61788.1 alcohol dehydrogenase [Variibacter gotjawalensis]
MKAVLCEEFCTPEQLKIADIADPVAEVGQVVVGIKAVGLNFFDILQIAGKYQIKPPFPFSPGAEIAGVVESVGEGVTSLKKGDRVMGSVGHNGARERLAVSADQVYKIPDALEFDRAAALIITYGTTYYALKDRARLQPGESLAVLGAAGGVGLAAVELGKLMGARVIACASSDEKLAFIKKHGADATINYSTGNLRDALREATGGKGVDCVYDPVGGAYTEAAVRALDWEGRLLVIGFAAGEIPKLPLNLTLLKNCDIRGVFWGAWTRRDPKGFAASMQQLIQWAAEKKISAHVHASYKLDDIVKALDDIANRKVMGKAVLTI